jgi:hypothetical protein
MPTAETDSSSSTQSKRDRRRIRQLERQLADARADATRRSARLERARRDGGARKIERRSAKLARARVREEELAARIAKLQAPAAAPVLAYCLRDKERVELQDPEPITMRNGQPALAGHCPKCGSRLVRAVTRAEVATGS